MRNNERGFTLVEMIVSIGLFAVVMLVSVGALLSLTGANRKAQALQSVMNNLNIALDGMVRNIRMGTNYQCSGPAAQGWQNCPNGDTTIAFKPYCDPTTCNAQTLQNWEYKFIASSGNVHGYIERSEDGGTTWTQLTAPEVSIQSVEFYVVGADPTDVLQPKVVIVIKGQAGAIAGQTQTTFHVEATAVQRELDLP